MALNSDAMHRAAASHLSQWDAVDDFGLIRYIGQIWARDIKFPSTQQALESINIQEVLRAYQRAKEDQVSIQLRGTTLEEMWIAATMLHREFLMCLRNAKEYWPRDRIPPLFKRNMTPEDLWEYVYGSLVGFYSRDFPDAPEPVGILGVFLGTCAHTVFVVGVIPESTRILFMDSWEKGDKQSLLAKGRNAIGIEARKESKKVWSITRQEFLRVILSFSLTKRSYDYYLARKKMLSGLYLPLK